MPSQVERRVRACFGRLRFSRCTIRNTVCRGQLKVKLSFNGQYPSREGDKCRILCDLTQSRVWLATLQYRSAMCCGWCRPLRVRERVMPHVALYCVAQRTICCLSSQACEWTFDLDSTAEYLKDRESAAPQSCGPANCPALCYLRFSPIKGLRYAHGLDLDRTSLAVADIMDWRRRRRSQPSGRTKKRFGLHISLGADF